MEAHTGPLDASADTTRDYTASTFGIRRRAAATIKDRQRQATKKIYLYFRTVSLL